MRQARKRVGRLGLFGRIWAFGWIGSVIPENEFMTKSDRCLDYDKWV